MRYIILLIVLLAGCRIEPQDQTKTENGVQVDFLFEHDGIRVYRFIDAGNRIYFTKDAAMWEQKDGENSRPVIVGRKP